MNIKIESFGSVTGTRKTLYIGAWLWRKEGMADYPTKNEIRARLEVQIKEAGRDATVKQMRLGLQAHFGKSLLNMKNLIREVRSWVVHKAQCSNHTTG